MLCLCAAQWQILISNRPRTRKFSQLLQAGKYSGFWLFSPWSRVGHALRPIFILWLVKIWQVSSCGKFMQHLETCLLWQLKPTEFCVNLWCFTRNEIQLVSRSLLLFVASLFFGVLVEKYVALSTSEIRFRMASFSFFTLLEKSEAILALLDTFQELHLEWSAWIIIVFDVCFFYI